MTVMLVIAAYIAAQMLADIGSLRIVLFAGLSIDAGTFVYPLTFTLRDMVHKVAGRKIARGLIFAAAGINLLMAGYFYLVAQLPPDLQVGPQFEFALVLSPMWRIVVASIVAEVLAELLDTEIYHLWVTRITKRWQWLRVLSSNAVSVPVDSLVFSWGAFGGVLPVAVVWSIVLSNIIIKGLTTLISLPGIYLVKEKVHHFE